jgi:hypothetical protein
MSMVTVLVLVTICVLAIGWVVVPAYLRYRGKRLITCPETFEPAAVEVDALRAFTGLTLKTCTRWPEKRDCAQLCLRQVEKAPERCLVVNILANWYADKCCASCGKPFGAINWLEHKPALAAPDTKTVEWQEVDPLDLAGVLATHRPVCWNCHIAETFRREHGELVVDR